MTRVAPTQTKETPQSRAWLCVITNLLAFPGLGTIMARRRWGYAQAALTLLGFAIFMGFMVWFMARLLQVAGDMSGDLEQFRALAWSRTWVAAAGLGLCLVSWVWALFSSLAILRAAREAIRPPPVP